MKHFAGQEYYNEVIEKIAATGGRFLSQVQISTDDFPHELAVDYARITTLVFDLPEKALFMVFKHHELYGFMGEGYDNHWTVRTDCEYKSFEEMLSLIIGTFDEPVSEVIYLKQSAYQELEGAQMGWMSCHEDQFTFTADVAHSEKTVLVPPNTVTTIAKQVFGNIANHDYLTKNFKELCTLWYPVNSFSKTVKGLRNRETDKAVENCFWQRFADHGRTINVTKIMREKVKYAY